MIGGFVGNLAGTAITDAINKENQDNLGYWLNLAGESTLAGLVGAIGGAQFSKFTDVLKPIFRDIFIGLNIWGVAFSALTDWVKNIVKQIADRGISFSF